MKHFFAVFSFLLCSNVSNSQIVKKNWLIGGNGSFSQSSNFIGAINEYKSTVIALSPNFGYFLVDKLAVGTRISASFIKNDPVSTSGVTGAVRGKTQFVSLGPFTRYYFLNSNNRTNLFIEGLYQYQLRRDVVADSESKEPANVFSLSCGPVVFLNNVIGIEFAFGYSSIKYRNSSLRSNTFQTAIGLQIHLERER
jgi:hypothetical protein